jgi:hypothetical protein
MVFSVMFIGKQAYANVLSPGTITTCGEIATTGTYTLGNSISTSTGACLTVTSGGTASQTIIDGQGKYTITGNIVGDTTSGYGNPGFSFTVQNVTVAGTITSNGHSINYSIFNVNAGVGGSIVINNSTTTSIQSNGGNAATYPSGYYSEYGTGGAGGSITISNSTTTSIQSNGGEGGYGQATYGGAGGPVTISNSTFTTISTNGGQANLPFGWAYGGNGGSVTISGGNVNLSNLAISALGAMDDLANGTNGTLTINYTTLNHTNLTLSALSDITFNGPGNLPGNSGVYAGGVLSGAIPGDTINSISQCNLSIAGTYILGSSLTGDCNITANGVILNGAGYTLNGNIYGDGTNSVDNGHNFTLENVDVTGMITSDDENGGNGGAITISTSTVGTISSNGTNGGGAIVISGATVNIASSTISATGSTNGTLTINYTILNDANLTLSALSNLTLNGPGNLPGNLGAYGGGTLVILPGGTITNISQCNLAIAGTYTLGDPLTGNCNITANGVILNGAGYMIDGNIIGDGINPGDNGFNYTLQNLTVTGTTSANGAANGGNGGNITLTHSSFSTISSNGGYGGYGQGGAGGTIIISTSPTLSQINRANIVANGGNNWNGSSGKGGSITISGVGLLLPDTTISASGGETNGTLTINYSAYLLYQPGLTLSALSDFTLNGPGNLPGDMGSFAGGVLQIIPGSTISSASQCATLALAGTYTLSNDLNGDCDITKSGIILNGAGYMIDGNIIGDGINPGDNGFNYTLQNLTVTGTTSANGVDYIPSASQGNAGNGGDITILNATTSNVIANGGTKGSTNGLGGTIIIATSTTGSLQANGGAGYSYYQSNGNAGGSVTVTNSTTGLIQTIGGNGVKGLIALGDYVEGSKGGNGGSISILGSMTDSLLSNGADGSTNGGNGGTISVSNSMGIASSSIVSANGGDSTLCGYGGNGGSVSLLYSAYGTTTNSSGADGSSCPSTPWGPNVPSSNGGSSGSIQMSGQYAPLPGQSSSLAVALSPTPAVTTPSPTVIESPIINAYSSGSGNSFFTGVTSTSTSTATTAMSAVTIQSPQSPQSFSQKASQIIQKVANTANTIVNTPTGKAVQTTGLFSGLFASAIMYVDTGLATPWAASDLLLIPVRLWGLFLVGLGIRKRARPWGTVYDSVTKQPIDPAFVTAKDAHGRVVAEAITDLDGRYGFLLPDGTYYVSVRKTNYEFPSKKMEGKSSDELYDDLYLGGPVTIKSGEVLNKNIPLDQKNFDWNEYAKKKNHLMIFHSNHEKMWALVGNYIYGIGLIISAIIAITKPTTYSVFVLIIFIIVLLLQKFSFRQKKLGYIMDKNTRIPLSFAIVRVTTPDHQVVLRSAVCDSKGRYYCIVPKGEYIVDIENKNQDGSYSRVYESPKILSNSGIVNSDFAV